MIATTTGQGVMRKPVSTCERPSTPISRNGSDTKASPCVANEQIAVITDSAKIGMRKRSTGIIGAG